MRGERGVGLPADLGPGRWRPSVTISVLAVVGLLLAALAAPAGAAPDRNGDGAGNADPGSFPAAPVVWAPCPPAAPGQPSLDSFQCTTVVVPLDWSRPRGRTISLGVVRRPARDPARRAGTLFFNPGGPGDQGSVYLPALAPNFAPEVQDRYDLVSWDPRGMGGRSTPVVQCFDSLEAEEAFLAGVEFPPVSGAEQRAYAERLAGLNRRCGGRDDELLAHVSTADTARDLDHLRRVLGERRTNYYGTSYGTFLGNTYANLFPDRIGRLVLDGTIDPLAWTRPAGPLSTFVRAGSDRASAATLASFFAECAAAGSRCAFSAGSAAATTARFDQLLERAAAAPIVLEPGEPALSRSTIVGATLGSLYLVHPLPTFDRFIGWSRLAELLQALWEASAPAPSALRAGPTTPPGPGSAREVQRMAEAYMGQERQPAVVCGESPNPATLGQALVNGRVAQARSGVGGATWPWIGYCVDWPRRAAAPYLGPFDRVRAPVLVIGVTGDPATPYRNAVDVARQLPGGRLLTLDGYGHTALANPSSCVQAHVADYLRDGTLPPRGTTCAEDVAPFAG